MTQDKQSVVERIEGSLNADFIFVCEHASDNIPDDYKGLGLSADARCGHIAWDPGAASVTRHLCEKFHAPAVLGKVSRLIYDCNRPPEAADAMPERSEIFNIPGNANLTQAERTQRVQDIYIPFTSALTDTIAEHAKPPALVTIHSFTPIYNGEKRNVQIGILHDNDPRLANAMIGLSGKHTDLKTLCNEPYGPEDGVTHTLKTHALPNGLLNVMIEVRNDLVQSEDQCINIADMLANLLRDALLELSAPPIKLVHSQ